MEILHYFGAQWSGFYHGMKMGVRAYASIDAAQYKQDALTEVGNAVDKLEDLKFILV
jgi:hypothetical protein